MDDAEREDRRRMIKNRRRDGNRKLDELLVIYRGRCCFCGTPVMRAKTAIKKHGKKNVTLCKTGFLIVRLRSKFKGPPTSVRYAMATVEHLIPLTEPKTNSLKNLRLACYCCNNSRGMQKNKKED